MQIKITDNRLNPNLIQPQHTADGAIDLYACIEIPTTIMYSENIKIDTGIKVAIPEGFVGLILPRSGKGSEGYHLANVVGVIDAGYRGPIIVNLKNNGSITKIINPMDRIAQMTIVAHFDYRFIQFVDTLDETDRGNGGFGSTG